MTQKTNEPNGSTEKSLIPQARNETAVTTTAVQAAATVKARYEIAKMMPRDVMQARSRLLDSCKRPKFASDAIYQKPVGKKQNESGQWVQSFVTGPSVRFAEEAMRALGNMMCQTFSIFDDNEKRIVRVLAIDLETNASWEHDITVSKTVERRRLKKGQTARGTRLNSYGDTIYIVDATDDEIENKVAALRSKAARSNILRLIPTDIIEEGLEVCQQTMAQRDAEDPAAARKRLADAFASIGVQPSDLAAYLGHDLAKVTPKELEHLRGIFSAVRDGEASWQELIGEKADATNDKPQESKTNRTRETLESRRREVEQEKETQPEEKPDPKPVEPGAPGQDFSNVGPPPMTDSQQEEQQLALSDEAGF